MSGQPTGVRVKPGPDPAVVPGVGKSQRIRGSCSTPRERNPRSDPKEHALRFNFAARLTLFATGLVCLSVGLCAALVLQQARDDLVTGLGAELLAISRSSASLVDVNLIEEVRVRKVGKPGSAGTFAPLRAQLDRLRSANQLPADSNSLFILRPEPAFATSGLLEFAVMPAGDGDNRSVRGQLYPARPHHRRALAGVAAASGVYRHEGSAWISASAPLRDRSGDVVALIQASRSVDFLDSQVRERATGIGWGALLAVLLGAVLSTLFARRLVRPLRQIADGAQSLSRGEPHRRLAIRRSDEIGDLAKSFDHMAATLEERSRDLGRAEERAETAAQAMITSDRLRAVGEFAVGMANELNNPLAYVRANLTLLDSHWQDVCKELPANAFANHDVDVLGEGIELIGESLEGLDHASAIIQAVRGLEHTGDGSLEPEALNELCEKALRVAIPQLRANTSIERCYEDSLEVTCASQQLQQVLLALIFNADHAMRDTGGVIRIETRRDDLEAVLCVSDEGEGVDPGIQDRIFEPFFTTKPAGEGTGLGLSIAREIARRHGGDVQIASGSGVGVSFEVRIPLDRTPDSARSDGPAEERDTSGSRNDAEGPTQRDRG